MRWARLWRRLRGGGLTRARAAASVGVGLWVGSLPVYGLHFPLCLALALPFSLDLVLAYLAANVSNPLFAPFLVYAEIQVGSLLLDGHFAPFSLEHARTSGREHGPVPDHVGGVHNDHGQPLTAEDVGHY